MEKDLSSWTKPQLQVQLRKLKLKVSGNKPDLIQRINASKSKYSKMKIPQLKSLLKERNLTQTGRKIDLVKRLEDNTNKRRETPSTKRKPTPKSLSQLFVPGVPEDIQKEILLNLNDKDLDRTCKTNKQAVKICNMDDFWNLRIQHIYGADITKYKLKNTTYRQIYRDLVKLGVNTQEMVMNASASRTGNLPIIKYLVEQLGADIKSRGPLLPGGPVTPGPIYMAIKNWNIPVAKYLITQEDDIEEKSASYLNIAALYGNLPMVKYIIEHGPTDIDMSNAIYIVRTLQYTYIDRYFDSL